MNNVVNWNITITGNNDTVKRMNGLSSAVHDELSHKIALLVQETLGLTSTGEVQVQLSSHNISHESTPHVKHEKYDASEYLVQLITSDFDGTLYPFTLALGQRVEEYIKYLQKTGTLDTRLHTLDTDMHQMMTEIARHYARTGNWQISD